MTNEEILTNRWKKVDIYLKDFDKQFKNINKKTRIEIQNIFNSMGDNLDDTLSINEQRRVIAYIENIKTSDDYYLYQVKQFKKKNRTYSEALRIMLLGALLNEYSMLDEQENILYNKVAENGYNEAIKDIKPKRKPKLKSWLWYLPLVPIVNTAVKDYINSIERANAEELYKKTIVRKQNNKLDVDDKYYKDLLDKQSRRIINIKSNSGAISEITDALNNKAYLQTGIDTNTKQCRFVAEIDKETTKMCKSLNNQIFYLDKLNEYDRYSDMDKKIVRYKTKGMVIGENLPPIDNHFHWCRSTITFQIN